MSYSTAGVYSNVSGATTAAAGNVIQSAVWNAIHSDVGTALTQVMSQLINTASVQRNILFGNGGFEVWQRGAGSSASISVSAASTAYTADRWYLTTGANQASVVAAATGLSNQSQLAAKITRTAAQTGTGVMTFGYPLDTASIIAMRGKAMACTFVAKGGANWSPTSGVLTYALYTGTGSVGKRGGGFTNETTVFSATIAVTAGGSNTTATVVGTTTVPLTATQAEFQFTWTPTGTAGADDSITIDDVQLECQQTSTTWTQTAYDRVPFSVSLNDCAQHYTKTFTYSTAPAQGASLSGAVTLISNAASRQGAYWRFANEMRTTPTITTYNPQGASANWQDVTGTASLAVTVTATSTRGIFLYSATAAAADRLIYIQAQADAGI